MKLIGINTTPEGTFSQKQRRWLSPSPHRGIEEFMIRPSSPMYLPQSYVGHDSTGSFHGQVKLRPTVRMQHPSAKFELPDSFLQQTERRRDFSEKIKMQHIDLRKAVHMHSEKVR